MFATVAVIRDPWEAHLLRGRLEADGIPAIVIHENHIGMAWYLSFALGRVKVQVPEDRCADAKEVVSLVRDGAYKELLREEVGDLDDPRCPYCGCSDYQRRRPYPRAALAILYSGLIGPMVPVKGWIYGCLACGARYRHELYPVPWTRWLLVFLLAVVFIVLAGLVLWALFTTRFGLLAVGAGLIAAASWTARSLDRAPDTDESSEQNGPR